MKIGLKLAATFTALLLVIVLISVMAVQALSASRARFEHFVGQVNARAVTAAQFRQAVDRRAIAARNLVLLTDAQDLQQEQAKVNAAHADVETSLASLRQQIDGATGLPDDLRSLVADMARVESAYAPVALGIVQLALSQQRDEAVRRMNKDCRPLLAALGDSTDRFAARTQVLADDMLADAAAAHALQRNGLLLAGLLAMLGAAVAGWAVTRSITRPLHQAVQLANAVAAGDLAQRVHAQGKDEVAQLLGALARMTGSLDGIVRQVRAGSDSIATGVAQVAGGNADLSQRTEQQAAALQQTAASMEQLNATVRNNADSAQQANQLAQGASTVATRAGAEVGEVMATMKAIQDSSQRMANIIGTIDGIAFQTNILALNAAVEAARAGEQGRGFAVVAGEVRTLAVRAAAAAREIKGLIDTSVERVGQGQALVDRAGATMGEVAGAIGRVTDIVSEISQASREQSTGVARVGEAITQMDRSTQQNAALVEQSAAASESLSEQARSLVQAVSRFRLSASSH